MHGVGLMIGEIHLREKLSIRSVESGWMCLEGRKKAKGQQDENKWGPHFPVMGTHGPCYRTNVSNLISWLTS